MTNFCSSANGCKKQTQSTQPKPPRIIVESIYKQSKLTSRIPLCCENKFYLKVNIRYKNTILMQQTCSLLNKRLHMSEYLCLVYRYSSYAVRCPHDKLYHTKQYYANIKSSKRPLLLCYASLKEVQFAVICTIGWLPLFGSFIYSGSRHFLVRDVTKFEFEFERFQQIRNLTNVLSTLLSNANLWKNPCSTADFIRYALTTRECRQTFFLKFNLSHKLQYWIN